MHTKLFKILLIALSNAFLTHKNFLSSNKTVTHYTNIFQLKK